MHMRGERVKILYLRTYYVNDPLVALIATYFPVGHRSIYIVNLQTDSNLCINATLASTCKKSIGVFRSLSNIEECFVKIVNGFQPLSIFAKKLHLNTIKVPENF